ncbi:DUF4174 domain-containing protein [Aquimonas voraii]|uniref:DUF4174 domain-containing protein n=1 Tax=Aquimonas voraii TaxID=265719 RepID=A0A1G6SKB6_9GAMM|nr:DUF4174 domain-containing protein [Aquimonas voraii]SDD17319.1 protein of unknown function [Aquimonas voraii]
MRCLGCLFFTLACLTAPAMAEDWLAAQQWQRRLIVVDEAIAPATEAPLARQAAALRERRVSVWRWNDPRLEWMGGMPALAEEVASGASTEGLRRALARAPLRPGLHLFGLDGGLKASRGEVDQLSELIDAVDSMPMRVRETKASTPSE